jgi:tRNA A37 methylthiotransferase MiaB
VVLSPKLSVASKYTISSLIHNQMKCIYIYSRSVKFKYYARQEIYSGLLGFCTFCIVQQSKEHKVSETVSASILR